MTNTSITPSITILPVEGTEADSEAGDLICTDDDDDEVCIHCGETEAEAGEAGTDFYHTPTGEPICGQCDDGTD